MKLSCLLALLSAIALSSCASLVEQLKDDPAIVGGTFTGVKLSMTALPGVPFPIPEVVIGRGTFYRIGGNRTVEVMAGDAAATGLDSAEPKLGGLRANSEASMVIKAGAPPRATVP